MYVQKGVQKITVTVRGEGVSGQQGNETHEPADINNESNGNTRSLSPNAKQRRLLINSTHALAVAKQAVYASANYVLQGYHLRDGDTSLQDQIGRRIEIIKDTTNVANSIAMGALYGRFGGPVGAVIGAVLGGTSAGINVGMKYAHREREYDYTMFKQNNAIEYQRARANLNLTTGRLR